MIFIDNKYTKYYYGIINAALARGLTTKKQAKLSLGYVERHHIIPFALNGSDSKSNLIYLTAKEHFVCHLLLTKMTVGTAYHKMNFALNRMITGHKKNRYVPSSRIYAIVKEQAAESLSVLHKGKKQSAESNKKRSATQKGKTDHVYVRTDAHRKQASITASINNRKRKGETRVTKGKTYEEIYGKATASKLRKQRSSSMTGRVVKQKTKDLQSKQRKGKNTRGDNSRAIPITINGVNYLCKKDACEALRLSEYKLNKLLTQ